MAQSGFSSVASYSRVCAGSRTPVRGRVSSALRADTLNTHAGMNGVRCEWMCWVTDVLRISLCQVLGYGTVSCESTSLLFVLGTAMKSIAWVNFVCVFNNFHPLITLAIHLETRGTLSNSTGWISVLFHLIRMQMASGIEMSSLWRMRANPLSLLSL